MREKPDPLPGDLAARQVASATCLAGDVALQDPDGLGLGLSFLDSALEVELVSGSRHLGPWRRGQLPLSRVAIASIEIRRPRGKATLGWSRPGWWRIRHVSLIDLIDGGEVLDVRIKDRPLDELID